MTISEHQEKFYGKNVVEFTPGEALLPASSTVYRITVGYDEDASLVDLLGQYLDQADKATLEALVIGLWTDAYEDTPQAVFDLLIARKAELPALRALFIGDITYEECEISWINQGSYNELLAAFPQLDVLRIRGSSALQIGPFSHANLRQLIIECGGLPSGIVDNLAASTLPGLDHLELWLGTENYGFDGDIGHYQRLLDALNPERLSYLGLRNAEIADEVAIYVAAQPWLASLDTLDLSLGTLGDAGAEALIASPYVQALTRLDVSHHYISAPVLARLNALPIEVIAEDAQSPDDEDDRYVAVGE